VDRRAGGPTPRSLYATLAFGVAAVSVAAPLIRLAAAPPLSIASYRLALAAAPVLVLALCRRRNELARLRRRDFLALLLSGFCLAAHFATWVASLKDVTVASSVALVTVSPLFVAAFALVFWGQRTSRGMLLAIGVSTAGGLVIGASDLRGSGSQGLLGDGLALAGAAFAAGFLLLGRGVRARVSLLAYVGVVYPVAALLLLAAAAGARQPLAGFSARTYLVLLLLAIVPQLCGHSALNWTLRYVSAHTVAVAVLGEPVIATALAALVLGEPPGTGRILGGALILAGVYLALREETVSRLKQSTPALTA
jgi:drug/metabolite transporter (DMT)-like permease